MKTKRNVMMPLQKIHDKLCNKRLIFCFKQTFFGCHFYVHVSKESVVYLYGRVEGRVEQLQMVTLVPSITNPSYLKLFGSNPLTATHTQTIDSLFFFFLLQSPTGEKKKRKIKSKKEIIVFLIYFFTNKK